MDIQQQLFTAALGIEEPIYIEGIEFENGELSIYLNFHKGGEFPCPVCGELHKVYDTEAKKWRHLNFFQYKCYLHFHTPRTECKCGIHRYTPPWSRVQSGFTLLFEAFIITLAKGLLPLAEIGRLVDENDTRLRRIVDYYVEKGYADRDFSEVNKLAVDETSSKKGHKYITVFSNQDDKTVIFATPGKDAETFGKFTEEAKNHGLEAEKISEISMDMSQGFQKGAADFLPNASVTFDRFHVIKLLNEAVDKVRREEQKDNKSLEKTRYIWLKNRKNLTAKQLETLTSLENEHLQTAEAYRLKMKFQDIYENCKDIDTAEIAIENWVRTAEISGLQPLISFAETVNTHLSGILRFFKSGLTNGISEGLNSLIGQVKRTARGYTNMKHFINMIYLIKGGIALPLF